MLPIIEAILPHLQEPLYGLIEQNASAPSHSDRLLFVACLDDVIHRAVAHTREHYEYYARLYHKQPLIVLADQFSVTYDHIDRLPSIIKTIMYQKHLSQLAVSIELRLHGRTTTRTWPIIIYKYTEPVGGPAITKCVLTYTQDAKGSIGVSVDASQHTGAAQNGG